MMVVTPCTSKFTLLLLESSFDPICQVFVVNGMQGVPRFSCALIQWPGFRLYASTNSRSLAGLELRGSSATPSIAPPSNPAAADAPLGRRGACRSFSTET